MISTPIQLKDYILRRLGAPIINVELTELQILDCIDRALELYGEYHYDGLHRTFNTFYIGDDDQYKHGVFSLKGKGVFAITQVLRGNVGSFSTIDGTATHTWFNDFILGLSGTGTGSRSNSYGMNAMGGDLSYYSLLMSYRNTLQDMLNPVPEYFYNADTEMLQFTGTFKKGDLLVVESYVKAYQSPYDVSNIAGYGMASSNSQAQFFSDSDTYDNPSQSMSPNMAGIGSTSDSGSFNNRWVKDYATSLAKELNGYVLAKHQGMSLPGGVTVDGVRLIEEAKTELDNLREELYLLSPPVGILVG